MAQDKGVDINAVQGSGENGRIVKKDIENYQPAAKPAASAPAASAAAQVAVSFVQGEDTENQTLR
jgi:pyruvate dehydrogenase E2 component (dihydrolipoamide acetyltransferase)